MAATSGRYWFALQSLKRPETLCDGGAASIRLAGGCEGSHDLVDAGFKSGDRERRCCRSLRQMVVCQGSIGPGARQCDKVATIFIQTPSPMTASSVTPSQVRCALLLRDEIALLDIRHEAAFATGHPLFAANMAADRIVLEAETRLPRKDVPIVVYDAGEGLVPQAADRLGALGYTNVRQLDGGLQAWRSTGFELFQDVNSYAKAFGELVEQRRHTPSLPAGEVAALIASKANIAILDVRRFDEYATMNIPGSLSVPGAELVLRAGRVAPDPETTIIVNCAGRTRSIIGTQSLINAGVANKVLALRNGTIGWTLARHDLEHAADRRGEIGAFEGAKVSAPDVAYRAGVGRLGMEEMAALQAQTR